MSILKNGLIKLSGNHAMQQLMAKNVKLSHYLMGIGSGGSVASSGEKAIFELLRRRLAPPYCVFDVGANQGQFLRLALDTNSIDEFTIHCFEPGCETFKILSASIAQSDHVRLNNMGIGKQKGDAILHYDVGGSGLASLTNRRLDHFDVKFQNSEAVKIETIDNYCLENGIDHIHLLKIDIEGHELDALLGAGRMLETKSIDIVTFEFGGCNIDTRTFFQDFWYLFKQYNMTISRITPAGYIFPIDRYEEVHEQFRTTNFVAMLSC